MRVVGFAAGFARQRDRKGTMNRARSATVTAGKGRRAVLVSPIKLCVVLFCVGLHRIFKRLKMSSHALVVADISTPTPVVATLSPSRRKKLARISCCPPQTWNLNDKDVENKEENKNESLDAATAPNIAATNIYESTTSSQLIEYHTPMFNDPTGPGSSYMHTICSASISHEELSSPTNDSDLEWKQGKHYSEEDDSTEYEMVSLTNSDEDAHGDYYDSDEGRHMNLKRIKREGVDPNCNIPFPHSDQIYQDGKIVLRLFLRFQDYRHFSDILKDYAIQEGFELKKIKHEKSRLTYGCRAIGCPWRIHASVLPDLSNFVIKTLTEDHTCQCVTRNRTANSTWIGKKLVKTLQRHPEMKVKGIKAQLRDDYGIDVDNRRLWRGRRYARG
ncbi:hypothetical protein F8388_022953 [Cannabis sativa]|uniref:Transposase MuDR plant domain-containing protein n=2 Tax=Cannabis sativa TaxID=3483 RepID=A0A7J6FUA6_CANSA|nr:hypothetical protein F8388_022953 [Cannabis sativa]